MIEANDRFLSGFFLIDRSTIFKNVLQLNAVAFPLWQVYHLLWTGADQRTYDQ